MLGPMEPLVSRVLGVVEGEREEEEGEGEEEMVAAMVESSLVPS